MERWLEQSPREDHWTALTSLAWTDLGYGEDSLDWELFDGGVGSHGSAKEDAFVVFDQPAVHTAMAKQK